MNKVVRDLIIKRRADCLLHEKFDIDNAIDTFNPIIEADDDIGGLRPVAIGNNDKYPDSNGYMGCSFFELDIVMLELLNSIENLEEYSFIDIGSGKGRAIFYMFLKHPRFKKYIGIEIDKDLNDIALQNLDSISQKNNIENINFLNTDALDYTSDNSPSVYFFFQPFSSETYQKFLDKNKEIMIKTNTIIINIIPYTTHSEPIFNEGVFTNFDKIFSKGYISIYKIKGNI
jgi:SAM-dependent methyltransferase